MRALWSVAVVLLWCVPARADAILVGGTDAKLFPSRIAIDVGVHAQIESTTMLFEMPALEQPGNYTITVPSPPGAFAVGVDIDRGEGFVALPTIAGPPDHSAGGDDSLDAWAARHRSSPRCKTSNPGR
jgi:hypothetical protein